MSAKMLKRAKPYVAVILMQFGYAGMAIYVKVALNHGLNHYTFVVYRHAIAASVILPFALFFEWKVRPKMTISIFAKILLLGLLEPVIDQNLYYVGMAYTTATFSAAMANVLPSLTFLMAWILGLEKVNLRRMHSQAKLVGMIVTVGGAMLMTLIKGPVINMPWDHKGRNQSSNDNGGDGGGVTKQNPVKGALCITAGCFCCAAFVILQAITLKSYPAELFLTVLICVAGTVEGAILALIVERGNFAVWSLQFDTKFFAILYSGIICSGFAFYVQGMIMKDKGPVFVTSFGPLCMVIVAVLGSMFLGEEMFLGMVIGAIAIVVGLYLVIWGKSKDQSLSKPVNDQALPTDQPMHTITNNNNDSSNHATRIVPTDEVV